MSSKIDNYTGTCQEKNDLAGHCALSTVSAIILFFS
jgi:hypothetical protein